MKHKNRQHTILLDSASDFTFVRSDLVDELDRIKLPTENRITITSANNTVSKISHHTNLQVEFNCIPNIKITIHAYLLDTLSYEIIGGRDSLEQHGIILNFRDGLITINNSIFEMSYKSTKIDYYDHLVHNKTSNICTINTHKDSKLCLYKKNTELPGEITVIEHSIIRKNLFNTSSNNLEPPLNFSNKQEKNFNVFSVRVLYNILRKVGLFLLFQ